MRNQRSIYNDEMARAHSHIYDSSVTFPEYHRVSFGTLPVGAEFWWTEDATNLIFKGEKLSMGCAALEYGSGIITKCFKGDDLVEVEIEQ